MSFSVTALSFALLVYARDECSPRFLKPQRRGRFASAPRKQSVHPRTLRRMLLQHSDTSLRLGVGDLLEFSVYNVPELTTKARVGSNGDVYLPLIDYVHLAGSSQKRRKR